ncbi:MAG: RsmB/NOP family class I SAM-dependent RNA methyltransferase [Candidatus Bathyarchaeota archaeon]|nr:RsmB/NOP family class I SAM-dependent RNA methyltransferase [Candidatus Bathyarchaeota archaeon]
MSNAIALALEALSWMELEGLSEREALYKTSYQLKITNASSLRLAYSLIFEVNKRLNLIDEIINTSIAKENEFHKQTLGVTNFLRVYVHWVLFKNSDINEITNLLESTRSIIGWKNLFPYEDFFGHLLEFNLKDFYLHQKGIKLISLKTGHPEWYINYLFKNFGRHEALKILRKDTEIPQTYIRINTLTNDHEKIKHRIINEGINLAKVDDLDFVYRVINNKPLTKLNSYRKGLFQIQDKSSCFSVLGSDPRPGYTVLDVCSAPGSKTSFIAQMMENSGAIYSIDNSKRRSTIWQKEMNRLNVENAEPIIADAKVNLPLKIMADLVLIDPPCSGTGIFMKAPSMKWAIDLISIYRYSNLQFDIIKNSAEHVKAGGTLTYSTCSITLEENEMLVERFLRSCPDFKLVDVSPEIGSPGLRGLVKCRRFFPHKHNCSGFFFAKMKRI